ncbi:hypothetical protein C8F01DRAFT_1318925 [Mycena amicta]|nr:hypothetical protein C8F01DRAFT_1318925 [Mycena amicta]
MRVKGGRIGQSVFTAAVSSRCGGLRKVALSRYGWRGAHAALTLRFQLARPPSHLRVHLLPLSPCSSRYRAPPAQTDTLDLRVYRSVCIYWQSQRSRRPCGDSVDIAGRWVDMSLGEAAYTPVRSPSVSPTHMPTTIRVSSTSSKPSPESHSRPTTNSSILRSLVAVQIADAPRDLSLSLFTLVAPTMQERHELWMGLLQDGSLQPFTQRPGSQSVEGVSPAILA